jgi:hypothetical protein
MRWKERKSFWYSFDCAMKMNGRHFGFCTARDEMNKECKNKAFLFVIITKRSLIKKKVNAFLKRTEKA